MERIKVERYWCRNCWSTNIIKYGYINKPGTGRVQNYQCKDCGTKSTTVIDSFTDWRTLQGIIGWYLQGQDIKEPYLSISKAVTKQTKANGGKITTDDVVKIAKDVIKKQGYSIES